MAAAQQIIVGLLILAWAVNLAMLPLLRRKGDRRAFRKSLITVAGASLLLIGYLFLFLRPEWKGHPVFNAFFAAGWSVMIGGFLYYWAEPVFKR